MQPAELDQRTSPRKPKGSFDSLAFAKRLQAKGFSPEQAEGLAEEQLALIDERLATKDDIEGLRLNIDALRLSTKADIDALRISTKADLETGLAKTRANLIMWVVGISAGQAALIIAVLKL